MPITDNDLVRVNKATRSGGNNISVEITWRDGTTSENRGTFGMSWGTSDEFKAFLEAQTFEEMMRAVLLQVYNRDTGALRPTVFDALPGKIFRVLQRTQEV